MKRERPFRTFTEFLVEWLQDAENAKAYLKVVLEEYAKDHDCRPLLCSLKNIAAAQKGISHLIDGYKGQ